MVETAGIEPASENLSIQLSPGADGQFKFPAPVRRPSGWPEQYLLIRYPKSEKSSVTLTTNLNPTGPVVLTCAGSRQ